jgi:phage replication O-like protein O
MISPTLQPENGFLQIKNEIAEALARTNLSAYQSRILWALWRKTLGWNKTEDWISNSQFVVMTGISKGHVSRAVKELILRNIVTQSGNKTGFNQDYTHWRELPHGVRAYQNVTHSGNSVTPSGNTVTPSGKKVTPSGEHNKHLTKDTSTKDTIQKKDGIPYHAIIDYLNLKTRKRFTLRPKATIGHINARWGEGYTMEDFKTVIDNKCTSWLLDPKMAEYLRPETLFGSKFESYLNEIRHPMTGAVSETTRRNIAVFESWTPPGKKPEHLPTQDEELAEFNARGDTDHPREASV